METKEPAPTNWRDEHVAKLKALWEDIKVNMPQESLEKDEVWYWWPTLVGTEPNYEALVDNLMAMRDNPHVACLTMYYYGMAGGIQGMMDETILPVHTGQAAERVPTWLDKMIQEDVFLRYGEKH